MNADRLLTPSQLKAYLKDRGSAPLRDVLLHFDAAPSAVRQLIEFWRARGHIRQTHLNAPTCESGCGGCSTGDNACAVDDQFDLIEWIDASASPVCFDVLADYDDAWKPSSPHGV
ncbi:FeoC-like transcriptional regulator [Halothiobacillus sp. DCM-1]|uniref:FeoC-like transcriptional regulator n=1 Tax=Halothiobacillus sp. DCM-1 TaxID=3112558 RepID=UPI003252B203